MSYETEQVQKFYEIIWNQHNKAVIPDVLDANITFRGSLGHEKRGHSGFAEYLDAVHKALGAYQCIIEELVTEPPRVFAKMRFIGYHRSEFLGYPPTGKQVTWPGAARFLFKDGKVIHLWVLGDLKALEAQLAQASVSSPAAFFRQ